MIVIEVSPNAGYFRLDGIDYPKGHYCLKYDNIDAVPAERNFSLCNVYDGRKLISSRGYAEIQGVSSWDELVQLLNSVGVVTEMGIQSIVQPYELQVSQGKVEGVTVIDKFGLNPQVTTGTDPEDIWEGGGIYPFSTTADIVSVSSSDGGDTQDLKVYGLDIDGNEVEQTVTLQGQTRVALQTSLWRVYRMENEGDVPFVGTVYCYSGTANTGGVPSGASVEKARIDNGNNQTLMATYTIPKGKVGFLCRGEAGLQWEGGAFSGTEFARIYYQSRRKDKVFKIKKVITLVSAGSSNYQDKRSFPDIIPELTDIKLTAAEVSSEMGIWAAFDIQLVDESQLSAAFLQAIGQ